MNIIVQCDGGLSNRINNLINGIYLSRLLERKLYVWWALNNACLCPLEKLFSNDFNPNYGDIGYDDFVYYTPFNTDKEKRNIKNKYGEFKFRLVWKQDNYPVMHKRTDHDLNVICPDILSELRSIQSPTLAFSSSLILTEIMSEILIRETLFDLMPISELRDKIDAEIKDNSINSSVIGIHLRKTDYNLLHDNDVIASINKYLKANGKQKFLICSDSYTAEQKFKNLYPDNVILIKDKSYVEKINNKRTDREFSNLIRTERSVQNALVDMYLLAHTSFEIFSPISTFAQTAFRLSKIVHQSKTPPVCPC